MKLIMRCGVIRSFRPRDRHWMARLVDPELRATRKRYLRHATPRLFLNCPYRQAFASKLGDRCLDVVAHQVQLVIFLSLGGMNSDLRRRRGEDQPAAAGIDSRETKDVAEECACRFVLLRVDQR